MNLAICIPTFNRGSSAVRQIEFFLEEIERAAPLLQVALYVRDNRSDPGEYFKIINHHKQRPGYTLKQNATNVGLVGNLLELHRDILTLAEYVWFVGDDDKLIPGVLRLIAEAIRKEPDFIFINHEGTCEGEVVMDSALPHEGSENRVSILDIFDYSGPTMMFITACIYKVTVLTRAIKNDVFKQTRLTAPLYWSLYCGRRNVSLIYEKMIINQRGNTSWENEAGLVFGFWLPIELVRSAAFSASKMKSLLIIFKYAPACSRHLGKYLLRSLNFRRRL